MDKANPERTTVEKEQQDAEREEARERQTATPSGGTATEEADPREDRSSPEPFSGTSR